MNNCRIRRTGTPARRCGRDGQECPSYNRFATVVSWPILRPLSSPAVKREHVADRLPGLRGV